LATVEALVASFIPSSSLSALEMASSFAVALVVALSTIVSAIPTNTADCTGFAQAVRRSTGYNVSSSVYVPAGKLNITGLASSNAVPFCRVFASKEYGDTTNEKSLLNFELWLPDKKSYTRRYMSVGRAISLRKPRKTQDIL